MYDENLIRRELSKQTSEFLMELAGGQYATPMDRFEEGIRLFSNVLKKIKNNLCQQEFLKSYCNSEQIQHQVQAVTAVADLMGGSGHITAAVLVIQVGIENVCKGTWRKKLEEVNDRSN
jgi:hypothetical protein